MSDKNNNDELENIDGVSEEEISFDNSEFSSYDEDLNELDLENDEEGNEEQEIEFEEELENEDEEDKEDKETSGGSSKGKFIIGGAGLLFLSFAGYNFLPLILGDDNSSSQVSLSKPDPAPIPVVEEPVSTFSEPDEIKEIAKESTSSSKGLVVNLGNKDNDDLSLEKDLNFDSVSDSVSDSDSSFDFDNESSSKLTSVSEGNEREKSSTVYVTDPSLVVMVSEMKKMIKDLDSRVSEKDFISSKPEKEILTKYVDKIVEVEVEKKVERLSKSNVLSLLSGRTRLKGYSVIKTSRDGTMSIVKTDKPDKKRTSVFFKGESIYLSGIGKQTISSIEDNGFIALVGSKWFIDEKFEPVSRKRKVESKPKKEIKKEVKKIEKKQSVKEVKSNGVLNPVKDDKDTVITSSVDNVEKFYRVAEGWALNGVYSGGSYLIETATGEWIKKKIGDKLPALGVIKGVSKSGDLLVGDYIIKLAVY